jgi:hypothetical protein
VDGSGLIRCLLELLRIHAGHVEPDELDATLSDILGASPLHIIRERISAPDVAGIEPDHMRLEIVEDCAESFHSYIRLSLK